MLENFPKNVRIVSVDYKIIFCDDLNEILDGVTAVGAIDFLKSQIRIYSKMSDMRIINTLFHEILHGIVYELNLCDCFKDKENEERLVDSIANVFADTINRNKLNLIGVKNEK